MGSYTWSVSDICDRDEHFVNYCVGILFIVLFHFLHFPIKKGEIVKMVFCLNYLYVCIYRKQNICVGSLHSVGGLCILVVTWIISWFNTGSREWLEELGFFQRLIDKV